jgi:hypothetical protein
MKDIKQHGVTHRLAGDGSEKRIVSFCINWAFRHYGHLQIDTYGDKKVMQKNYREAGIYSLWNDLYGILNEFICRYMIKHILLT